MVNNSVLKLDFKIIFNKSKPTQCLVYPCESLAQSLASIMHLHLASSCTQQSVIAPSVFLKFLMCHRLVYFLKIPTYNHATVPTKQHNCVYITGFGLFRML